MYSIHIYGPGPARHAPSPLGMGMPPPPACGLVGVGRSPLPPACGLVSVLSHSMRKRESKKINKVYVLPIAHTSMLICCKINVFEKTLKSSYSQYECTGFFYVQI